MKWNQGNPRYRRPSSLGGRKRHKKNEKSSGFWQGFAYRFKREPNNPLEAKNPRQGFWSSPGWLERLKLFLGGFKPQSKEKFSERTEPTINKANENAGTAKTRQRISSLSPDDPFLKQFMVEGDEAQAENTDDKGRVSADVPQYTPPSPPFLSKEAEASLFDFAEQKKREEPSAEKRPPAAEAPEVMDLATEDMAEPPVSPLPPAPEPELEAQPLSTAAADEGISEQAAPGPLEPHSDSEPVITLNADEQQEELEPDEIFAAAEEPEEEDDELDLKGLAPRLQRKEIARAKGARRLKYVLMGVTLVGLLLFSAFFIWPQFGSEVKTTIIDEPIEILHSPLPKVESIGIGSFEMMGLRQKNRTESTVKDGHTLSQVLEDLGFPAKGAGTALIAALSANDGLKVLRPGDRFVALWKDNNKKELSRLEFFKNGEIRPLILLPDGSNGFWSINSSSQPISVSGAASGVVESSLWEAASKVGLDPNLIVRLSDILASDIDFMSDIKKGDSFYILFQREYQDGQPKGNSTIDMVVMTSQGRDYEYHHFMASTGQTGYYTPGGLSNKKSFFMSPLQFTRISSGYTMKRMHPIHKVVRPHQGIDYAAPSGTPVVSVADGLIIFQGRSGGYGNLVTVKHGDTYATMYAHLSRFAKGLSKGSRISQGDIIGYVGATGTATGPHLDFRMKRDNNFVNPLPELAKQEGKPIDPLERPRLTETVTKNQSKLKSLLAQK